MTLLFVMVPALAWANTPIQLVVNGTPVVTDVPPVLENDRTLVPVRALSEALGFDVKWDEATRAVTLTKGERVIVLYIGREETLVDGQPKPIDVPPVIRDNRTLIPVRFVAENLGLDVSWDPESRVVGVAEKAPAVTIDPAVQALWDGISTQKDGHITGTFVVEAESSPGEVSFDGYVKGNDMLMYVTMEVPVLGEATVGMAMYEGKTWQQLPGMEWALVEGSPADLGVDLSPVTDRQQDLSSAKAQLSQDQLNGETMSKLTLEWDMADLMKQVSDQVPGGQVEGTMTMTFWVSQAGELKQIDLLTSMKVEGTEVVVRGTYHLSPLEGEIPFPAEIMQ